MSEQSTLSDRTLDWAAASVHPQATVLSARRLHGGVSTPIHALLLCIEGEFSEVVLRQFDDAEWLRREPDLVRREAASLAQASRAGVRAPRVIATDEDGSLTGKPSTLMTKLEGEVVLQPPELSTWLRGLAQAIVRLHAMEPDDAFPWTFRPYTNAPRMDYSWSKLPSAQWETAISIVTGAAPEAKRRFIHRDYHPANVLWSGGEVSGIVDWVNGCIGPVGIDIGHCRVNLVQLYGIPAADEFLAHYCELAGTSFSYDPYWDLVTLIDSSDGPQSVYPGWTALGFTGLTDELVKERLEAYLTSLLSQFNRS